VTPVSPSRTPSTASSDRLDYVLDPDVRADLRRTSVPLRIKFRMSAIRRRTPRLAQGFFGHIAFQHHAVLDRRGDGRVTDIVTECLTRTRCRMIPARAASPNRSFEMHPATARVQEHSAVERLATAARSAGQSTTRVKVRRTPALWCGHLRKSSGLRTRPRHPPPSLSWVQVLRPAVYKRSVPVTPFSSTGPISVNETEAPSAASTTSWLTTTSPGRAYSAILAARLTVRPK
jgi:hypothetical protein